VSPPAWPDNAPDGAERPSLVRPAWVITNQMKRTDRKECKRTVEKRKLPRVTGAVKEAWIKGTTV